MHGVAVQLQIYSESMLKVYDGRAQAVEARAEDGRIVRFPANILRPFVLKDGVRGRFWLEFDSEHRYVGIRRL